jgi:hypothetical protein
MNSHLQFLTIVGGAVNVLRRLCWKIVIPKWNESATFNDSLTSDLIFMTRRKLLIEQLVWMGKQYWHRVTVNLQFAVLGMMKCNINRTGPTGCSVCFQFITINSLYMFRALICSSSGGTVCTAFGIFYAEISRSIWSYLPGYLSRYSNLLWAGWSRDRFPMGARFSAPIQTGLLYIGYSVFPGGKAARAWHWRPTPIWCRG